MKSILLVPYCLIFRHVLWLSGILLRFERVGVKTYLGGWR